MAPKTVLSRLYILDFGLFRVFENSRVIGIPGYLIQTQDGQNILVDTGFPPKYAQDARAASLEDGLGSFGELIGFGPQHLPDAQLAQIGLSLADIDLLILSHGDIDHVGSIGHFAGRDILIGKAELESGLPRYFGNQRPINWPQTRYQTIDQDTEPLPGLGVLYTPGHSPGHLSLLLDLPKTGPVLLTCDAISRPAELSEHLLTGQTLEQAQRLMSVAHKTGALVMYGHSPEQWPTLKKAPAFYT